MSRLELSVVGFGGLLHPAFVVGSPSGGMFSCALFPYHHSAASAAVQLGTEYTCHASPDGGCGCAVLKLVLSWASLSHYWLMYQEQPSQQLCCGRSHLFSFLHARIFTRQVSVVLTGVPWDAL